MLRESNTIVVERNQTWARTFETEPNEAAWAKEAIYFVRAVDARKLSTIETARVQISPDGIHWCDEGSIIELPNETSQVTFVRVTHFGGWLRLAGELPKHSKLTVMVYLSLKG